MVKFNMGLISAAAVAVALSLPLLGVDAWAGEPIADRPMRGLPHKAEPVGRSAEPVGVPSRAGAKAKPRQGEACCGAPKKPGR